MIILKVGNMLRSCCLILTVLLSGCLTAYADAFTVSSNSRDWMPLEYEAPASSGLEKIYVLQEISAATQFTYSTTTSSNINWKVYTNLGGGFATDIPSINVGSNKSVAQIPDNIISDNSGFGIIIEVDGRSHCYWIVNYSYPGVACQLGSLSLEATQECDRTALQFVGNAPRIIYYSINGLPLTLSREITLSYYTLSFDEEAFKYVQTESNVILEYAEGIIRVPSPLCNSEFTMSADRFQFTWINAGKGNQQWFRETISPMYATDAIACETKAIESTRDNDNEMREEKAAIGGSGPVDVRFMAEISDAVIFKEWQFSHYENFEDIDIRIQETDVTHVFENYGTTYVRFVAGNASGSCDYYSQTFSVYIGESKLECPNVFSPYGSPGVNDEWKVSYKSILDFDCHIFNRWGQEIIHLTDPSQGWDGRYNGKLVPSGVYYYVIKASGTDGKEYKLSGDINILKSSGNSNRVQ